MDRAIPQGDATADPLIERQEPILVIQPARRWTNIGAGEVWNQRELLFFLVWRDIKVRYKQTAIGAIWAIVQPLMNLAIFTVVFGKLAKIPSDGIPYPLFAFVALLPWNYFSQAISRTSMSLLGSSSLISKIYFPRLIIPLASVLPPLIDFAFSFAVFAGMLLWYKVTPTWGALALPLFLLLAVATALSVGLWFCALNVRYRDVGYVIPFLVQFWMYASPIIYPVSLVPEKWRLLYSLNPMTGVIEGFRWALLGMAAPDFKSIALSAIVVLVLLAGGILYFKRVEDSFADVI
jgi:lipopolysaccharide transport system permease protein